MSSPPASPDKVGAMVVRDVMDSNPETVGPDATVEDVVHTLRTNELPGVPVVDGDGRCLGIVTEADLVLPDDQGDLHLPHYINLFGGTVFLEPLGRFEGRLRKAFASTAAGGVRPGGGRKDAPPPRHGLPGHEREGRGAPGPRVGTQPPARGGRRASRGRGHAPRPPRRPRGVSGPERALATIELGAIERNCARLPKPLCAVVKADAYGHGPVAAAALKGGATWLAVGAAGGAARRGGGGGGAGGGGGGGAAPPPPSVWGVAPPPGEALGGPLVADAD